MHTIARQSLALTAAGLLGLALTACGGSETSSSRDEPSTGTSSSSGPEDFEPLASGDLGKVCSGDFRAPDAAAYTSPAEAKVLVFEGPNEGGYWHSLPLGSDAPFGADTENFQETNLLACAEVAEAHEEDALTCDGEADGPVTFQMVPATWTITLRAARTGAVVEVADETVESQELGCREDPILAPDDVVHIAPSGYEIRAIVEDFLAR